MGFSLVGNSGSSSTTSNVYETSYSASLNPQLDLEGSGAGASAVDFAPLLQGSTLGDYAPSNSSIYAPVNTVSTGAIQGDSAIAALSALSSSQTGASEAAGTSTSTDSLSSLLSGNTIYWILGAIIVLFLAHPKS